MSMGPKQPETSRRAPQRSLDSPELLVGRILEGRYRLDSVLNKGGMGVVFEATQVTVGRRVAVKILRPTLSQTPGLVKRFRLEVETVAQISHPNVVGLIDSGRDAMGLIYLVMEFVEGKTLRQSLRSGDLKLWEILEVFSQVCNALVETHGQHVIHRDLKLRNIMVVRMRDGAIHVKLLDFGVAKLLARDVDLTEGGQITGTPGIIAPELVDGDDPTAQSDLYSIGVLLFTALAGQAPFSATNDLELMRAHKVEPLPDLAQMVGHQVPSYVVELTCQLLAKDPGERPRSALALRNRLDEMARRIQHHHPDATSYVAREPALLSTSEVAAAERIAADRMVDELSLKVDSDPRSKSREPRREKASDTVINPMVVIASSSVIFVIVLIMLIYILV